MIFKKLRIKAMDIKSESLRYHKPNIHDQYWRGSECAPPKYAALT